MRWVFLCLITLVTGCDFVFQIDERACQTSTPGYAPLVGLDNDSRYRFESQTLATWRTAEATCLAEQAHLFVPDSPDELTALYAALPTFGITIDVWAGAARDAGAPTFTFVTGGDIPPSFWAPNEPGTTTNNVVVLVRDVGLRVDTATNTNDYVCECDGQSVRSFSF